ncbi:MAG: hypothetical protein M1305_07675, partial [Candidatus Marsarchaeota archaeon]|nr:hypothetical protein [Candidatus Marsarchaeota archaeon]
MHDHKTDRLQLIDYLRQELFGPWEPWDTAQEPRLTSATELDMTGEVIFGTKESAYGPFCQLGSREEILQRDRPCKRYGVGVLYPTGVAFDSDPDPDWQSDEGSDLQDEEQEVDPLTGSAEQDLQNIADRRNSWDLDDDDFSLSGANEHRPSTMAVSFLVDPPAHSRLVVSVRGGRYQRRSVRIAGHDRVWWARSNVSITVSVEASVLIGGDNRFVVPKPEDITEVNTEGLPLSVKLFARPQADSNSLVTVSLTNRSVHGAYGGPDESCLFQTRFRVQVMLGDTEMPS